MMEPPIKIKEALLIGWKTLTVQYKVFVPVVGVIIAISIVSEFVGIRDDGVLLIITVVLGAVAQIIISMGLINIALRLTAGLPASFDDVFSVTHLFFPYLGAAILYGLIVMGGFFLLIIPGVIWFIHYWLFQYTLIDKEIGVLAALSEAKRISHGVRWPLCKFIFVTSILNIAGIAAFGIGLFITLPITTVATAHVYRSLQKRHEIERVEEKQKIEERVVQATKTEPSPI